MNTTNIENTSLIIPETSTELPENPCFIPSNPPLESFDELTLLGFERKATNKDLNYSNRCHQAHYADLYRKYNSLQSDLYMHVFPSLEDLLQQTPQMQQCYTSLEVKFDQLQKCQTSLEIEFNQLQKCYTSLEIKLKKLPYIVGGGVSLSILAHLLLQLVGIL